MVDFNSDAYQYSGKTLDDVLEDLENNDVLLRQSFAASSSPSDPTTGQLWYDTANNILKIYYSGAWRSIYNASTQAYVGSVGTSNLTTGCVTEAKIGSGAVTEAKIGSGAVTSTKLGSGAAVANIATGGITATKLGTGSVTVTKIPDDTVTAAKMSSGLVDEEVVFVDQTNTSYKWTLTFTNGVLTTAARTSTGT